MDRLNSLDSIHHTNCQRDALGIHFFYVCFMRGSGRIIFLSIKPQRWLTKRADAEKGSWGVRKEWVRQPERRPRRAGSLPGERAGAFSLHAAFSFHDPGFAFVCKYIHRWEWGGVGCGPKGQVAVVTLNGSSVCIVCCDDVVLFSNCKLCLAYFMLNLLLYIFLKVKSIKFLAK
jgi:hypothetical protein